MKEKWLVEKQMGSWIGLITNCFKGIHPEFSMLTTKEFLCDDKMFLQKLANSILDGDMRYYDHYLFFGGIDDMKDIFAFIIVDPCDKSRFRVIKTRRPFYSKSLEIKI